MPLRPEHIEIVLDAVRRGLSSRQAAELVGCSDTTVRSIRSQHGCSAPTGRQETKPWRWLVCRVCGHEIRTKRDNQVLCGRTCRRVALAAARWKLPSDASQRRALLMRLYWDEGLTSVEIASRLAMSHKGVLGAMRQLDIPRRGLGPRALPHCIEPDCRLPIYRVRHKTNGSWYGRRCRLHWIIFRMAVNQRYNDKHLGKDDEAWLRRSRQLLARVQRLNREVSQSLRPALPPAMISPAACPR